MIEVDYRAADTFLFAYITDISAMGIFVRTPQPAPPGTRLQLRFTPSLGGAHRGLVSPVVGARPGAFTSEVTAHDAGDDDAIECDGEVIWINPSEESYEGVPGGKGCQSPGMGIRFESLSDEQRDRLMALIRTFAYLDEDDPGERQ